MKNPSSSLSEEPGKGPKSNYVGPSFRMSRWRLKDVTLGLRAFGFWGSGNTQDKTANAAYWRRGLILGADAS